MKIKGSKVLLAAVICAVATATAPLTMADDPAPFDVGVTESWGESTGVVQAGRFFIAGQPDAEALERAKAEGVSIVINLRGESETDWDEAGVAASKSLDYYQVPLNGAAPELAAGPLIKVSEIVQANPDARILVHCSSGNRASAWFAVYLADWLGMGVDEAIAVANQTGLNKQGMEDKVRAFLAR